MNDLNEETSGNSANARSENLSDNREAHRPDIQHKVKTWKEYFLEFLMIFLAVTLGFVAENFREFLGERAKEKDYIEGFIRNLKDDVTLFNHVIEFDRNQVKGLDSMLTLAHATWPLIPIASHFTIMFVSTAIGFLLLKVTTPLYCS